MIEIKMTGMCEGCEYADLDVGYIDTYDGKRMWVVECRHRAACERARKETEHQTQFDFQGP